MQQWSPNTAEESMEYTHQQQARRVQKRRIQCNGETVCKTSGWLCWAVRRGLVWQWPSRQRRRERASLSPPVVRNEFRKPLNQSAEKRRAKRLTSRTNEPLQRSFPSLALSIIWYSPRATTCICTTLPLRISNRPDAPLSCVIGQHSLRSNTEAPIFARKALSYSQPDFCTDCVRPALTASYWPLLGGSMEVIEARGKSRRIRSLQRIAKVMASDDMSASSTTSAR